MAESVFLVSSNKNSFLEFLGVFLVNIGELEVLERERKVVGGGISFLLKKVR
jgi:hypothetical protein